MSSISAIGTNHAKILTGLRDGKLCNNLAESKAKKWTNMVQVLQDVTDMAVNFRRSRCNPLPSFEVSHTSSYNNCSSNHFYRSNKQSTKEAQQSTLKHDKLKCWHWQGDHLKKDCPTVPHQRNSLPSKPQISKEQQHNFIKSFQKRFQNRRAQVNEITTSEDDSFNDQLNQFFSEFENLMCEDTNDTSNCLHGPQTNTAIVNEVFIEGFLALYKVQICQLKTAVLFDTGASINAIPSKFFSSLQQQLKVIPTNRKVVLVDGNSLGPIGEVHLQFQLGNVVFHDRFVIMDNLQCYIILGLPWHCNYRIGCNWNQGGKHFITIKNQFLALSIAPHVLRQLSRTKGQCTIQCRSITWISVQTLQNLDNNSLYEISLDRQLATGIITLDMLHNLNHKQPHELMIPLLHMAQTDVKLL